MQELIELILDYVEPDDEITAESNLRMDCGLSSFDMMAMTEALSELKGVKFEFEETRKCITVQDLLTLCEAKTK